MRAYIALVALILTSIAPVLNTTPAFAQNCSPAADPLASALGVLVGQVPAPCVYELPDWYTRAVANTGFDLDVTTEATNAHIQQESKEKPATIGPGKLNDMVISDIDHTILQNNTLALMRHKTTGEFLRDPDSGTPIIRVGRGASGRAQRKYLEEKYVDANGDPTIVWSDYVRDTRALGEVGMMLYQPEIPETIELLKKAKEREDSRLFVITARGEAMPMYAVDAYLAQRGIDVNGAFSAGNRALQSKLGISGHRFSREAIKAVIIASLMQLYGFDETPDGLPVNMATADELNAISGIGPALGAAIVAYRDQNGDFEDLDDLINVPGIGPSKLATIKPQLTEVVRTLTYYDDKDQNLERAMQLLPRLYPQIRFTFVDPVHVGHEEYELQTVAVTAAGGRLIRPDGTEICPADISAYRSDDVVHPITEELQGPWVER